MEDLFLEISIILVMAAVLAMLVFRLHQPLIIGYLLAGLLVGAKLFPFIHVDGEIYSVAGKIGVAFLLFTVGLGLNWRGIKNVAGVALATGVGQFLFTSLLGFPIGLLLGFDIITSIYLAVAFTFSSTVIVIKLLSDKEDLETLYGRIVIGILLVQDFIAIIALLVITSVNSGAPLAVIFSQSLLKGLILLPLFWLVATFIVPKLVTYAARSQELLYVFSIAWCFLIAGILSYFNFSLELGALIAGITLSGTVCQREISARIRPLRDFFLIIFFVVLGTQLNFSSLSGQLWPIVAFTLFILIGNPLIVLLMVRLLGYHPRTGVLAGLSIAQISEFSFILIATGIAVGHLAPTIIGLVTAVGLLTIAVSTYFINYNEKIFKSVKKYLYFLIPPDHHEYVRKMDYKPKIILFGIHRTGMAFLDTIKSLKKPFVVVDFDPQLIHKLNQAKIPNIYGDAGDEELLHELGVQKAELIISTVPDVGTSLLILSFLKKSKFKGVAVVSARTHEEAMHCYDQGATYVIVPSVLGGEKFKDFLMVKKIKKMSWEQLGKKALKGLKV